MAFVEEFWDILKQIHNNDGLHAGVKKTFARVRTYADCIKLAGLFGQLVQSTYAEDTSEPTGLEETHSESLLPRSLSTQKKHLEICKKADAAYLKAIEKMGQKYSKHNGHHIKQFAVGDNVSNRIPRIDRANTDLQRLPCIIVEIVGKACTMYRLCCKVMVLGIWSFSLVPLSLQQRAGEQCR